MAGFNAPKTAAISIAGLGDANTVLPLRINLTISTTVLGNGEYVRLLNAPISSVSADINPFDGTTTQGTITAQITNLTDTAEYGDRVREFLMTARNDPVALLHADITAAATTVDVIPLPGKTIAVDDTIYLQREAMHVSVVSGGGGGGGSDRLTVTRGVYGTTAAAHTANAWDDTEIYSDDATQSGNPIVEGREVTLYEFDHDTNTETLKWRGFLESPSESSGVIHISARDLWGYIWGKELGLGAWTALGVIFRRLPKGDIGVATTQLPNAVQYDPILVNGEDLVITDGKTVTAVNVQKVDVKPLVAIAVSTYPADAAATGSGYPMIFSSIPEASTADSPLVADQELREVLVAAPGFSHFRDSSGALSSHPFDILVCLLVSTGSATWTVGGGFSAGSNGNQDCLPAPWGLGLDSSLIDTAGIDALIADGPYADFEMEAFLIGEDGPVDASEVFSRIFQATFTFPAITSDGKFTIKDLRDPGTGNADFTLTESDIRSFKAVENTHRSTAWPIVSDLVVKLAHRGPGKKHGLTIYGTDLRGAGRKRYPASSTDVKIDAGWFGQVTSEGVEPPLLLERLQALYRWRYLIQSRPLPVYEFGIGPEQGLIPVGSVVEISHPGLLNVDATRGITSHRCTVISAETDYFYFRQRLTVVDLFAVTRGDQNTSPAWQIATLNTDTNFTITAAHFTAADANTWINSARYLLLDQYGVIRSTDGYTTGSISGNTVTLDAAWTASSSPVSPAVGDVIIPAQYDDRSTDWANEAYIADTSGTLGTANDDQHRWGF